MTTDSSHIPLASQMGGHPGILTSLDTTLLIKPALGQELYFYETAVNAPEFQRLRDWIPRFYGTLRLHGRAEGDLEVVLRGGGAPEERQESLVLENICARFMKPNIIDLKLGTVLYDDLASPDKKERMEKVARETTSGTMGVRVTGLQVYDNVTSQTIVTPKAYGKSITAKDLPEAFRRFFPAASSSSPASEHANSPCASNVTTKAGASSSSSSSLSDPGLPPPTLLPILQSLKTDVEAIRDAVRSVETRMVGASLLVVYEGDSTAAERWKAAKPGEGEREREERLEAVIEEEEEESDEEEANAEEVRSVGEDAQEEQIELEVSSDASSESGSSASPGPSAPYVVRLIDFAHTTSTPGRGPDEGVLLGLDTVLRMLEGRIQEVTGMIQG